ncbi:TPA: hypothetical protein U5D21_004280 [Yersinia enterocolitica]|nr:hypothetical protein [Yersinia enterocolitica]
MNNPVLKNNIVHNAKTLASIFYKTYSADFDIIIPNCFLVVGQGESDLLCIRKSLYIEEIETKITKQDFYNDFKKTIIVKNSDGTEYTTVNKHAAAKEGLCFFNRHWFLLPEDIIELVDIPEHSGLMVPYRDKIKVIKSAPLLHRRKADIEMIYRASSSAARRIWDLRENVMLLKSQLVKSGVAHESQENL